MIPDAWQQPQRILGLVAVLSAAALLSSLGGLPGVLFGVGAVGAWIAGPPVFAFVIAQAGVGAVFTPSFSLGVIGTELALVVVLLSDATLPWTNLSRGIAGGCAIFGGAVIWGGQSLPTWQLAGLILALGALLIYAVHRYELLTTNQLNHE